MLLEESEGCVREKTGTSLSFFLAHALTHTHSLSLQCRSRCSRCHRRQKASPGLPTPPAAAVDRSAHSSGRVVYTSTEQEGGGRGSREARRKKERVRACFSVIEQIPRAPRIADTQLALEERCCGCLFCGRTLILSFYGPLPAVFLSLFYSHSRFEGNKNLRTGTHVAISPYTLSLRGSVSERVRSLSTHHVLTVLQDRPPRTNDAEGREIQT